MIKQKQHQSLELINRDLLQASVNITFFSFLTAYLSLRSSLAVFMVERNAVQAIRSTQFINTTLKLIVFLM